MDLPEEWAIMGVSNEEKASWKVEQWRGGRLGDGGVEGLMGGRRWRGVE
jgi:hypothetical protein